MSPLTERQTFRETVALVATAAKAKLPLAVNGRIESAAKLVLRQDVEPQADGTILVGSASDPGKQYRLVGHTCECQDFTRGQAPGGFCQHRIAAGIHKRVMQMLAAQSEPEVVLPEERDVLPDHDDAWPPDEELAPEPTSPVGSLPEAPASCNVYVLIDGHKVQVTLRDSDEQRMLARLKSVLAQYPAPEPFPAPWKDQAASQAAPVCKYHGTMK